MTAQLSWERIMKIANDVFWMLLGALLMTAVDKLMLAAGWLAEGVCK